MIEGELRRMRERMTALQTKIVPALESKTEALYALIIPLQQGSEEREKLEAEYTLQFKELRLRADEIISIRQQIAMLESQMKSAPKPRTLR